MKLLPQLFLAFIVCPLFLFAQTDSLSLTGEISKKKEKNEKLTLFEFFSQDPAVTEVTLKTDMDSLMENKFRDFEVPSTYSYIVDGKELIWKVKVSPRGKSRKMICDMPPFLLNFSKDDLKERGIKKKHDKLKLVNYCDKGKKYENYLLREYLIYKLYNIITENSFNVKLINVTYLDAQNNIDPVTKHSFLIEDTDEMADRLNAKEVNTYSIPADSCSSYDYDVLCMFQYMISNTDWNLGLLHNTKLIQKKKTGEVIPVPYDFDYSGLVNADYAVPNPDYPQTGIRHRVYIGDMPNDDELVKVSNHFIEKEKEVFALINSFELLDKGWRKDMARYIKKFYKDVHNQKRLKRRCLAGKQAPRN
jgi:hypothetical protein